MDIFAIVKGVLEFMTSLGSQIVLIMFTKMLLNNK